MILRTVLAVALATALFAVSMPVVDDARAGVADARTAAELDRLDTVATVLVDRNDPVRSAGARRILALDLPVRSWGSTGLASLTIGPRPDGPLTWRLPGGPNHTAWPSAPLVGVDGGLTLDEGGRRQLRLRLTERAGEQIVVVSRALGPTRR